MITLNEEGGILRELHRRILRFNGKRFCFEPEGRRQRSVGTGAPWVLRGLKAFFLLLPGATTGGNRYGECFKGD
ncbi:hypothetical protein, partial [Clostridium boliviensis]|uniref:hypothetical protein n=1 Tax=Clostridium boliviensis TaxID=318465 RepID=UPI002964F525